MVTGCYAQRAPQEIAALPGVAWVVGNSHKHRVAEIAAQTQFRDQFPAEEYAAPQENSHSVPPRNFVSLETVSLSAPAFTLVGDIFAHTELIAAPVFAGETVGKKPGPI